jgi:hypothetical protein
MKPAECDSTNIPERAVVSLVELQPCRAGFWQQIGKDRSRQWWEEMAYVSPSSKNIQQHCVAQWQTFVQNTIPSPSRTKTTAIPGCLRLFKPTTSSAKTHWSRE